MTRKAPPAPAGASSGDGRMWETFKGLLPYMWPPERPDIKARVIVSLLLLVGAKIVTVLTPYTFKYATDALTASGSAAAIAVTVPLFFVLAYGLGRIMMVALAQLRDAVFAKVS